MVTQNSFHQQAEELIPAVVRMISGCHSEQTSADVSNVSSVAQLPNPAGRAGGACTSALLDILHGAAVNRNYNLTFQDLLLKLRENLANSGFDQIPQLTSSRPLELEKTPFHIVGGTGARRALLVGINYVGQSGELSGCHNDVLNVKKYLTQVHGFQEKDVLLLVDDTSHPYPTRHKIISGLEAIVSRSRPGDSVYFHYSGHGGLLNPEANFFKRNAKEYDETLYPVDHQRSGQIRDYSLFNRFVKPMAAGVTVTCVMDCCHSGSVLDLPYSFQPMAGGGIRSMQNFDTLSNLAFLYVLAGGILPAGFDDVAGHIGTMVGGDLDAFQGVGIEAEIQDEGYEEGEEQDFGQFFDDVEEMDAPDPGAGMGYVPEDYDGGPPIFPGDITSEGLNNRDLSDGGYGNVAFGDDEFVEQDNDDGDGDEGIDCGCLADVMSSLLEGDDEE